MKAREQVERLRTMADELIELRHLNRRMSYANIVYRSILCRRRAGSKVFV